ncbi:MAG: redoxin domain-containing protein [Chthonomonadales bacterium]
MKRCLTLGLTLLGAMACTAAIAQQAGLTDDKTTGPGPGHSLHGEAFNEGPRQKAYLMAGMANVKFPITTKSSLAQKYFNQGISQLHGFWYFEAERTFRQVNAIDPDCAMAYWGMAMSNAYNEKRAAEFIKKADEKKAKVSEREKLYIESLMFKYNPTDKTASAKAKHKAMLVKLNEIIRKYPDDIEAKAFQAVEIWENQGLYRIWTRGSMEYMLNTILAVNPMHPVHHYRVHLWDGPQAKMALNSAARCGQSSPGIAHMWHMPGHIYSDLDRYIDACWQQEAGVRTDNAQLIRDRVMPDQIHNYAHNSEWFTRNLSNVGRVHDAISLSSNMIEMPRHPAYNVVSSGGNTSSYGRIRLIDVLVRYEMWPELLSFCEGAYIDPGPTTLDQVKRLGAMAVAYFATGKVVEGEAKLAELKAFEKPADKSAAPHTLEGLLDEVKFYQSMAYGRNSEAEKQLENLASLGTERRSALYLEIGNYAKAVELATAAVKSRLNEVHPLAVQIDALYRAGDIAEATKQMKVLQAISGPIDLDVPIFRRISAIASNLGCSGGWKMETPAATDTGIRPPLDTLGPFRWTPSAAPDFTLPDGLGHKVTLSQFRKEGKPVLVVFYLGTACKQCMKQLNIFAPVTKDFAAAGIPIVAVSTDTVAGLKETVSDVQSAPFPFPLLSDKDLKAFKAFRAYDDFEKMALHGCYLIDRDGLVRWQDISYQPFSDPKFLLEECKRLLRIPGKPADSADRSASTK